MDNLTHTLFGVALARCGFDRHGPAVTATLVVGANLPDLDAVAQALQGQVGYLIHHRGITHSLAGILAQIPLLAWIAHGIARRRAGTAPPTAFGPFLAAAAAGLLSHPLLDLLNTYGVRPWLPFDGTWYYGDVAFIVDPWLWLTFGAGACLAAPRSIAGTAGWMALATLAASVCFRADAAPPWLGPVWTAAALAVAAARWAGAGRNHPRVVACAGIAGGLAYLAVLLAASRAAEARGLEAIRAALPPGVAVESSSAHPQPAVPWRFGVIAQTPRTHYRVEVDHFSDRIGEPSTLPRRLDDPALDLVARSPEHRAWRLFARHPFVGRHGDRLVLGDARYTFAPIPAWCNFDLADPGDVSGMGAPRD